MVSFLSWCWVGLILGVSFIATPAKFLSSSSSLNQLLEVGQVTFSTFMFVEIVLIMVLFIAIIKSHRVFNTVKGLIASLVLILLIQYTYLLPLLDIRVDKIAQGIVLEPSRLHLLYIFAELSKLVILITLGTLVHQRSRTVKTHAIT